MMMFDKPAVLILLFEAHTFDKFAVQFTYCRPVASTPSPGPKVSKWSTILTFFAKKVNFLLKSTKKSPLFFT